MEDAIKAQVKRNKDGKLLPGHGLISPGRPKGQSLKEYWRKKFAEMSEEEKEAFTKKTAPDLIWQMAEGRPSQGIGQANDLDPQTLLVKFVGEKDNG